MGIRLNGKRESEKLKLRFSYYLSRSRHNTRLRLAVILVGRNLASETYVKIKKKFGEEIGIKVTVHRIKEGTGNREQNKALKRLVNKLNVDTSVTGILLQLPLPKGFKAQEYIDMIDRKKDVDGLKDNSLVLSPVAEAVRHLLKKAVRKEGKKERSNTKRKGVLLVKSQEFANSLLTSLKNFSVKWDVKRILGRGLLQYAPTIRKYNIVVSALGFPHAIMSDMIKKGAVIIDVGFTKTSGGIKGDFHPDCYQRSSFYSPVPGGVGPLTVAYVFKNLLKLSR